jgi:3-hydroxyacyl-CoA dehydrogenase
MSLIGVVGPGLMGIGIAQVAAAAGYDVALLGRNRSASQAGLARFRHHVDRQSSRRRLTGEYADLLKARVFAVDDAGALADCAVAIETVYEQRDLKVSILEKLERAVGPEALIATNTSGLPIGGLAGDMRRPDRFIGLHFFSPVERMKIVEVVPSALTSQQARNDALKFVQSLKLSAVVVKDSPGFFTSRVFCAYLDEALALVGEGVDPQAIDAAALAEGRAMGPLAVLDNTSLALSLQQSRQARLDGLPAQRCRPIGAPVLERMIDAGRPGRRGGGGFFEGDPSAGQTWSGLTDLFPRREHQPSASEIWERLWFAEAMEALRALEEGVAASADDADTASVLALGFPKGGVLRRVETEGLGAFIGRSRELAQRCGERFRPTAWLIDIAKTGSDLRAPPPGAQPTPRGSAAG